MMRMIRRVVVSMVASFEKNRTEHERPGPHCGMLSALLASHLVPLLAEIFLDLVHSPRRLVLHRDEGGTCCGVVGVREIECRHEGATASANLSRGVAHPCCSRCTGSEAGDCGVLVHPAFFALSDVF